MNEGELTEEQKLALLRRAFGAAWLAEVRKLPLAFEAVALASGMAFLAGWSEQSWLYSRDLDMLRHTVLDCEQPHADAANRLEQAVAVLKERRLWPWMLTPRA